MIKWENVCQMLSPAPGLLTQLLAVVSWGGFHSSRSSPPCLWGVAGVIRSGVKSAQASLEPSACTHFHYDICFALLVFINLRGSRPGQSLLWIALATYWWCFILEFFLQITSRCNTPLFVSIFLLHKAQCNYWVSVSLSSYHPVTFPLGHLDGCCVGCLDNP